MFGRTGSVRSPPRSRLAPARRLRSLLAASAGAQPTPRQVERFWTPRRMAAARPLEMTVGRDGQRRRPPRPAAGRRATASYSVVETPEVAALRLERPPLRRQGGEEGFCSATAIDSPSRSLVLTAGHCVNTGPREGGGPGDLVDLPGVRPRLQPRRRPVRHLRPLRQAARAAPAGPAKATPTTTSAPSSPNRTPKGSPLADAVGGGATIVTDLGRAPALRNLRLSRRHRTDAHLRLRLRRATTRSPPACPARARSASAATGRPGASGGGWLIDGGTEIDGITTYSPKPKESSAPTAPTSPASTVGRLVAGL